MSHTPPEIPGLNAEELEVVLKLGAAWDKFLTLEQLHADHVDEFRHGIHHLQNLIMARPVQRQFKKEST